MIAIADMAPRLLSILRKRMNYGDFACPPRAHLGIAIMVAAAVMLGDASMAQGANDRRVVMKSVFPAFGVDVRVDGAASRPIVAGDVLALDARAHHLDLACVSDACEPLAVIVPAGSDERDLHVALTIRPARLQIEGNLAHRFVIDEEPSLGGGCAGVAMTIPMQSGQRAVHVTDLDDRRTIGVVLRAGRTLLVSFF